MSKVIITTGVSGQDGSLMVDYLLKHTDYKIYGAVRRLSVTNYTNIEHINNDRFELINIDLSDSHSIEQAIIKHKPDYFINFAAQSFVGSSWDFPKQTFEVNATAVLDILESIRTHQPKCRFYNAGSSEEFGDVICSPQDESHPLRPRSPYGASKASARHLVKVYRESYELYAVQGWLFNHEGTRRGYEFVTRKITSTIAKIKKSIENGSEIIPLEVGNMDAERDWSDAEDFTEGVWLMLNQEDPEEYVLSSGEVNSVRNFITTCLKHAGITYSISGSGVDEKFSDDNGNILVKVNPEYYRPAEVNLLKGDPSLAISKLGWKPKYSFGDLVEKMYNHDYDLLS
jgi:GDPmannose 4,6-dehydratase